MTVEHHGYLTSGAEIRTTELTDYGPGGKEGATRENMRIDTRDVGQPLHTVQSLSEFLRVMYDTCAVQRNLYRKSMILHRDISDSNIMIAPNTEEFRERCAVGYDEVKYINQVLAENPEAKPQPACLVIDLGNGADIKTTQGDPKALAERTGATKFIARSISSGKHLPFEVFSTFSAEMPKLEGKALDLYRLADKSVKPMYETFNEEIDQTPRLDSEPAVDLKHQLFHDAESMFWVIVWSLARSTRPGSQPEQEWRPGFNKFIEAMNNHRTGSELADGRVNLYRRDWEEVLHEDLACMLPMILQMHQYVRLEWAFSPNLNPEHVHEALMRLLLKEIVRINETGEDVPLAFGVRSLPVRLL